MWKCFLILSIQIVACLAFGEILVSIGVGIASTLKGAVCHYKECCTENWIQADFDGLESTLKERVYGQHLVNDIVVNSLRSHWSPDNQPSKALTLSFHGWPGSGKNYVASFIIKSLYKKGINSKYVHSFVGRIHFPNQDNVATYQRNLYEWIKGNVSDCPRQLFVFDEVDKMPAGVLDIIKPMIDYHEQVEGIDYRQAVFIFLSNTGAHAINENYLELWMTSGLRRDDLKLEHFEKIIAMGAFNEQGGFYRSETIQSNLIDHYIPFLPMEKIQIRLCILDQFKQRNVEPSSADIEEVMNFIEWGPTETPLFSKTGCKRISQKVGVIVARKRFNSS